MLGKKPPISVLRELIPSEANSVRRSVYMKALEQLADYEQKEIAEIQLDLKLSIKGIGTTGSLEVVAAVGQWLNKNDPLK